MWRNLEADAIEIGLNLDYFWSLTPKQYEKHQNIYLKVQEQELKKQDSLNWALGRYISFSVHEPNKYPKKPFTTLEEQKQQTDIDMEQQAMLITAQLGGNIKWQDKN